MEVLFALISDRYELKRIMLSSNLPFSRWEQIFGDALTTAAAIDRLVHHSIILELNLPSNRLEQRNTGKSPRSQWRELIQRRALCHHYRLYKTGILVVAEGKI